MGPVRTRGEQGWCDVHHTRNYIELGEPVTAGDADVESAGAHLHSFRDSHAGLHAHTTVETTDKSEGEFCLHFRLFLLLFQNDVRGDAWTRSGPIERKGGMRQEESEE